MENCSKTIGGNGEGEEHKMLSIGAEQCLVGTDNASSPADPKERAVLEEQLYWARLERQKVVALSAEADETIWDLATLARRTMQERDEARNQARMILADVQARANVPMTMLHGRAHPGAARPAGVFAGAGANSQALAPTPFRPLRDMAMQGQHDHTGTGYCVASSSNSGHRNRVSSMDAYAVPPSLHGIASSTQEHVPGGRPRNSARFRSGNRGLLRSRKKFWRF